MLRTFLATVIAGVVLVACARDESPRSTPARGPGRGEAIARGAGCASCHGGSFQGGVGPGWVGLAGSEVELTDGLVVVADDAYLYESIRDPSTKIVAGYGVQMPRNALGDEEIRDIVEYIRSLSE